MAITESVADRIAQEIRDAAARAGVTCQVQVSYNDGVSEDRKFVVKVWFVSARIHDARTGNGDSERVDDAVGFDADKMVAKMVETLRARAKATRAAIRREREPS